MWYFWTSDWEQRKLGDLADSIEYGLNASATIYDGENIYIRITDIDESSHLFLRKNLTSPDTDLSNANNYLLETGDLLFARTGASVGKTYQYNISDGKVYFAGFLIRARIKKEFNSNFIFQNTLTSNYQNFIIITSQRSGQPGVNAQEYATFQLAIPSREEQDQLGTFFEQIDKTIALHQRKLALIKRLKQTYLDALFPQNDGNFPVIRFSAFSDSWEEHKFSDIVNRVSVQSNDSNLPKVEFEDIVSGEGRLNKDISQKFDSRKGTVFEPEFILYGKLRPYLKNWLFPNFKGIALGDFWVFEPKNPSIFSYYLIQSDRYQIAANLSSGTKMPRSDWKIVSETVFNIPNSIEEQEKIGFFFKQLDEVIDLHQCKLEKCKPVFK